MVDTVAFDAYLKGIYLLDQFRPQSFHANSGIAVWTEHDWEKGEREFLKALELNHRYLELLRKMGLPTRD